MGEPEPERRRPAKQRLRSRRAQELTRTCAQDRRANQENDFPRRSTSGLSETDDDHGQPRENDCSADVQPLLGRTVRFLFQETSGRPRPSKIRGIAAV
jgi:hypothetical protein